MAKKDKSKQAKRIDDRSKQIAEEEAVHKWRWGKDCAAFVDAIGEAFDMNWEDPLCKKFMEFVAHSGLGMKARVLERDEQSARLELTKVSFCDDEGETKLEIRLTWPQGQ